MDTSIFLDINRFALRTAYLHGVLARLAGSVGLAVLAALFVLGGLQAGLGRSRVAAGARALVVAVVAVAVTVGLGEVLGHVLDRATPSRSLKGIEVIGSPATGFSLPDLHVAVGAAIAVVVLALGARALGSLVLLVALVVGFAEVYVGAHFPVDELAGLGLGIVVSLLAVPVLRRSPVVAHGTPACGTPSLTAELAGLGRAGSLAHAGPAANPVPIAASGSVRLLESPSGGEVGSLPRPRLSAGAPLPAGESQASTWTVLGGAGSPPTDASGAPGEAKAPGLPRRLRPSRPGEGPESGEPARHPRSNVAVFPSPPESLGG